MKKAILATKVGMTQIFDEKGTLVPVTVLQAGPCVVTQVKTGFNDIPRLVEQALSKVPVIYRPSLADILEADRMARQAVLGCAGAQ